MENQPPIAGSDPFVSRLPGEVEAWEDEQLVRQDTGQIVLARYGLVPGETALSLKRSKMVYILAVLGAILAGTGVILIVSSNWGDIPKLLRLVILLGSTGAAYHLGYRMAYQPGNYPKVGIAVLLLGSMLWGASIFLVSQMYHLGGAGGGGEKTALLIWFFGVLPLAYILWSPLHMGLALAIGTVWLCWQMSDMGLLDFRTDMTFVLYVAIGACLYALSRIHARWRSAGKLEGALRFFALAFVFYSLYMLSFKFPWSSYRWYGYHAPNTDMWTVRIIVLVAGFLSALWLYDIGRKRDRSTVCEALVVAALVIMCLVLFLTRGMITSSPNDEYSPDSGAAIAWFINAVLFLCVIGIIAIGWHRNRSALLTFGVIVFALQVIARYFEVISTMLRGGLFFLGAGALLILGAVLLDRTRRALVATTQNGGTQ